jgi:hypothetical protein
MLENHKLADLLAKFETKIDSFIKDNNLNSDVAKDVKELIQEKLNILDKRK